MTCICFYRFFVKSENKSTEYMNSDYTNVIKFIKVTLQPRPQRMFSLQEEGKKGV